MVAAKNSLAIKGGYALNQLITGRNPGMPKEKYQRKILEGMRKVGEIHIQQQIIGKIKNH